jgi:hypothetical protein
MTTEKPKGIIVPPWMVTSLISLLIGGFTAWGVASAKKAETETRLKVVEQSVEKKVDKELFNMVVDKLNSIEAKVDKLREEK